MKEQLQPYLGRLVGLIAQNQTFFGQLATDGTNFGFPPNIGFPPEAVKELRVIDATEEINRVRAVIVL